MAKKEKKKSLIGKILRVIVVVVLAVVLAFGLFVAWASIKDFQPEEDVVLKVSGDPGRQGPAAELTLLNWNIGYAGLGKEQDFFMDGGTKVRPSLKETQKYLRGIQDFIQRNPADIILLQEVDRNSRRSHRVDQAAALAQVLPDHAMAYAPNFKVAFVPTPPKNPMGGVDAGLVTFSRYPFWDSRRLALPGSYSWPTRIFHLDRCVLVSRHPAPDGKEWVIFHTHNSAYDASGQLRRQQLIFLGERMEAEYRRGNYVVLTGDWNSILPGARVEGFQFTEEVPGYYLPLPEDFTPEGWQWAFDPDTPTNRSLASAYREGETYVTIIDGFLVSPNVTIEETETISMGFALSDHQPVKVRLKTAPSTTQ